MRVYREMSCKLVAHITRRVENLEEALLMSLDLVHSKDRKIHIKNKISNLKRDKHRVFRCYDHTT